MHTSIWYLPKSRISDLQSFTRGVDKTSFHLGRWQFPDHLLWCIRMKSSFPVDSSLSYPMFECSLKNMIIIYNCKQWSAVSVGICFCNNFLNHIQFVICFFYYVNSHLYLHACIWALFFYYKSWWPIFRSPGEGLVFDGELHPYPGHHSIVCNVSVCR